MDELRNRNLSFGKCGGTPIRFGSLNKRNIPMSSRCGLGSGSCSDMKAFSSCSPIPPRCGNCSKLPVDDSVVAVSIVDFVNYQRLIKTKRK